MKVKAIYINARWNSIRYNEIRERAMELGGSPSAGGSWKVSRSFFLTQWQSQEQLELALTALSLEFPEYERCRDAGPTAWAVL